MKKSLLCLLMAMALLLTMPAAVAEEEGVAVPAMETSMEEAGGALEAEELLGVISEPFVPGETAEKLIIGADNRTTVDARVYPYSAIAYMEVEARCGCDWTASGFLVAPDVLMTGAHCVVCTDHGQTANKFTMYFGYQSKKNYLYCYTKGTTYWYGTDFKNSDGSYSYNGHVEWDYAYIQLSERVGETVGWFGLTALSDEELAYSAYELTGYRDGVLKTGWGCTQVENKWLISYTNDSLPGNSGCPVFNDEYYVVAIHVAESKTTEENFGRRITSDLIREMRGNGMFD